MKRLLNIQIALFFIWLMVSGIGLGQVPQLINYQGVLLDPATGQPVPDNSYQIIFSIYDVASGSSAIWTESEDVETRDGLYNVLLGSTTPLTPTILSGSEKYLGIKVGSDPEMTPRKRIVSVAYAYISESVSGASNIFPSDGNVGIGTTIPNAKFEVIGSAGSDLEIDSPFPAQTFTTVRSSKYLSLESKNAYGAFVTGNAYFDGSNWQRGTTTYGASQIAVEADEYNQPGRIEFRTVGPGNDPISWYPARMVIEDDGNVGIGTTNPTNKLHLAGSESVPLLNVVQMGTARGIRVYTQNACALWVENAGNHGLRITNANGNGIHVEQAGNWAGYFNGDGYFNSHVCIGTMSKTNILTVVQNSSTDPIADAWTTYSSKRWKTNIQPIESALDKVNRLRGVSYDWKANGKHDIGLIAEEVGEVIPEVVAYEENGKDAKSIDYARLVAVLIEANKELQKEIEQQKITIDNLLARILNIEKTIRNSDTKLSNVTNEIQ